MIRSSFIFKLWVKRQSLLSRSLPPGLLFPLGNLCAWQRRFHHEVTRPGARQESQMAVTMETPAQAPNTLIISCLLIQLNPEPSQRLRGTKGRQASSGNQISSP